MNPFTKPNLIRALPAIAGLLAFVATLAGLVYGRPFVIAVLHGAIGVSAGMFAALAVRMIMDECGYNK